MCWILLILVGISLSSAISPKTYGPFDIRWDDFNVCSGPKPLNSTTFNATTYNSADGYKLELNMTVLTPSKTESIKITVYTINNNEKSILFNYKVDKPCKHAVISPVIGRYMPLDTCVPVKGHKHIVVNFTELAKTFLGSKFYYGDYLFKIVMVAKKGNVVCLEFAVQFVKK